MRNKPLLALTFDDGPDPRYTPQLLDLLRLADIKATFYVVGAAVAAWPDLALAIHDEGHEIGIHSMSHPPTKITPTEYATDFWTAATIIGRTIPALEGKPIRHRLPHGYMGDRDYRMAGLTGYGSDGWTVDSGDWRNISAENIYAEVVQQLRTHPGRGQVILMHDGSWQNGRRWPEHSRWSTLTALVRMFATLKETDNCVTMTEWEARYGRKYAGLLSNYR